VKSSLDRAASFGDLTEVNDYSKYAWIGSGGGDGGGDGDGGGGDGGGWWRRRRRR
jgi:hypothetical protein